MLHGNVTRLTVHAGDISEALMPLNPGSFTYHRQCERYARVMQECSSQWLDGVIRYHGEQSYGKTHGFRGLDGLMQFSSLRQPRGKGIL